MVYTDQISPENLEVFMPLIPEMLYSQYLREGNLRFYGIAVEMEAAGIVVIRERADIAELTYMYLLPGMRRMGYMDKALSEIMVGLREEGFSRMTMDYVPYAYPALERISNRFSFTEHKSEKAYFRFTVAQIRKCKAISYIPQGTVKLRALPETIKKELYRQIKSKGYDMGHITENADLKSSIEDHSMAYMEGNKPMGLMLVQDMSGLKAADRSTAFGRIFPDGSSADIALIYVGTTQIKAPLYLMSALCRDILMQYEENDVITGYFPDGHLTKLLEGTLGIKGMREMTAVISLDDLEQYDE